MATLLDYCSLIRSKNAGPFVLTFDLMCREVVHFETLVASQKLTRELIADLYSCEADDVTLVNHRSALAVKISIPRPVVQGSVRESDMYAGQQYVPLLDIELPDIEGQESGLSDSDL